MALFGDSITTDHISPGRFDQGGSRRATCDQHGGSKADFNSYGSRRGNHEVMMRGTFANIRIKNLMMRPGRRLGVEVAALTCPARRREDVHLRRGDEYIAAGTPTVIFGGEEYGTGSARLGRQRARSCWASRP